MSKPNERQNAETFCVAGRSFTERQVERRRATEPVYSTSAAGSKATPNSRGASPWPALRNAAMPTEANSGGQGNSVPEWGRALLPGDVATHNADRPTGGERSAGAAANAGENTAATLDAAPHGGRIPERVRASAVPHGGEYDMRRLRSQREVIRDVMLSAADCETWLTLAELRALTRYGEASISAQLRHLRKSENGGYEIAKRHREGATPARPAPDGRPDLVWEYRIAHAVCVQGAAEAGARRAAVTALA